MDKHYHARHISEGCVESVAWRTSASSVKGLRMVIVMMVHLYVAVFMVRFRKIVILRKRPFWIYANERENMVPQRVSTF